MTSEDLSPTIASPQHDLAPTIARPPSLRTPLPCAWETDALLPAFDFQTSDGIPCSAPTGFRPLPGMGLIWSTGRRDGRPATVLDVSDDEKVVWIGDDSTVHASGDKDQPQGWLQCRRWHQFPAKVKLGKDGWFRREIHTDAPPVIWGCRLSLYSLEKVFPGRGVRRPEPLSSVLLMPSCCVLVDGVVRQVSGYWSGEDPEEMRRAARRQG